MNIHTRLLNLCKYRSIGTIKEILTERDDIDICYDSGVYFYFALIKQEQGVELLRELLNYANRIGVNEQELAMAISNANERTPLINCKVAKKIIAYYLRLYNKVKCKISNSRTIYDEYCESCNCYHNDMIGLFLPWCIIWDDLTTQKYHEDCILRKYYRLTHDLLDFQNIL